jgi:hypothetical protein
LREVVAVHVREGMGGAAAFTDEGLNAAAGAVFSVRVDSRPMSNVVRSSFQAGSRELITKLVKAGYLRPALRYDADAVTAAIARLKQDLRNGGGRLRPLDRIEPAVEQRSNRAATVRSRQD